MNPFVPTPDVLPAPAPVPIFVYLLHLTFTLHLIAMNGMLGGILIALASFTARRAEGDPHDRLLTRLGKLSPTLISVTVTLGVAPLLFMQVIYGNLFYTSSIIIGWPWLLVVPMLIFAYYGAYLHAFKATALGHARGTILLMVALLLAAIGFMFSNNTTLMLAPERWQEMYFAAPGGTNLNTGESMLWPRYLHMVLSAVAVAGLLLALLGRRRSEEPSLAAFMTRRGVAICFVATALNVVAGFWFLLALREDVRKLFMGGSGHATGLLGLGVVLALAMLGLTAHFRRQPQRSLKAPVAIMAATMVIMVLMRDLVRGAYLGENFAATELATDPQWLNMGLFALLLLGGIVTMVWMLRRFFAAMR